VDLLTAFVGGTLDSIEDIQRALAPEVHAVVGAPVYRGVRQAAAVAAKAVGWSPRLSAAAVRVLSADAVRRLTGVVDGVLGTSRQVRPTEMTVRVDHRRVRPDRASLRAAFPAPSGRLVVLLHGLIETERWWFHRERADFGSRLADDLPCTPVYLRYNSGRPVADNAADLVRLLTELVAAWPVPVTEIVLVGHSMGGLVAHDAVGLAHEQHAPWLPRLTSVVCLGSPFTGVPLERVAARVTTVCERSGLRPVARLMALRSDGIKSLAAVGSGAGTGGGWPAGVREYRLGVTIARSATSRWGRWVGDLVVTSARTGDDPAVEHGWLGGLHHLDLLHHDEVYADVLAWLRGRRRGDRTDHALTDDAGARRPRRRVGAGHR
jgi:pimeloyl-ACP methyl ester carboxylesterase